jgi:transposase
MVRLDVQMVAIRLGRVAFATRRTVGRGRVARQTKAVLRKQLKRTEMLSFFANLPPCLIGMEACASAHHWARQLIALGHQVKLMAPQFVKPYVKSNKNDRNDAEAIGEAVARPNMRFVPVKSCEQQTVLALHRARAGFVKARTAQANQMRGLLGEFGIIIPQGVRQLGHRLPELLEDGDNGLPGRMRALLHRLLAQFKVLDEQVAALEREIVLWHRQNHDSRKVERIAGIGPLTASAYVASVGNAKAFSNGRQVAAWLGIVPRQDSSGGKPKLLGISKHGDVYLRTLLIHGARAVLRHVEHRPEQTDSWLKRLMARRGKNVAAVALANKNARIAWALLAHQREFEPEYVSKAPRR